MALLLRIISQRLRVINYDYFMTHTKPLHTHDYNFKYFRNKTDYKNAVVHLMDDFTESKLTGPGCSFLLKEKDTSSEGFFYHLMHRENVMKLSASQLKEIMSLMANAKIDAIKYANALKYIDEKCALSVERWPLDLSLYILDAWFIILGPKVFKKCYYSVVTSMWSRRLKKCSKYNLILMLYFIGMSKTAPPFLLEILEDKLENFVSNLADEELAIALLSFFKTSTRIKSTILLKRSCKVAENLMTKNDRFHLISILKSLRLSQYHDDKLMNVLADYIQKEHTLFNFIECTNFLATYASQTVYSSDVYNSLENQGIVLLSSEDPVDNFDETLQKLHPSKRSRVKDIARFLWGMAFVGHDLKTKSLNILLDVLNSRINSGEFEKNLPAAVDCLQSLILLNHYEQNIIVYVSNPSFKDKISRIDKAKPKYQLYFVYRSIYIENTQSHLIDLKFATHIPKTLEQDVKERNGFQELIDYFADTYGPSSFHVCYIIPHIMLSGIVLSCDTEGKSVHRSLIKLIRLGILSKSVSSILNESKQCVCIEILDPTVCRKNSTEPLSLMKTKIRQLQKMEIEVIALAPREINLLNNPEDFKKISKMKNISV